MTKLKLSPDCLALNPGAGRTLKTSERAAKVPRACDIPRDGLTTLLIAGWSTETMDGGRLHRLRQIWGARLETGWHTDQSAACAEAKRLQKGLDDAVPV